MKILKEKIRKLSSFLQQDTRLLLNFFSFEAIIF